MTAPDRPPAEPTAEPPEDQDDESLVPALLAVYALYLLWRAANGSFRGSAPAVERALQLRATIGPALAALALRALRRQRAQLGRVGDALWDHADVATEVGVQVGLQTLAEALLWSDRHMGADMPTADAGGDGTTVPTRTEPPAFLARLVAGATANAARMAAAEAAGLRTKIWQTMRDTRVRDSHVLLQGQRRSIGEPFVTGVHKLQFPHDPSAPLRERANCFVPETPIVAPGLQAVFRAPYRGPLVTVSTGAGRTLTGTPNHPMLTSRGWCGLGDLHCGDQLVQAMSGHLGPAGGNPDIEDLPAPIGDVYRAAEIFGQSVGMTAASVDFHGDRPAGQVDVVTTDRSLRLDSQSRRPHPLTEFRLVRARPPIHSRSDRSGALAALGIRDESASDRLVRRGSVLSSLGGGQGLHSYGIGSCAATNVDVGAQKSTTDRIASDAESICDRLLGFPSNVSLDDVVNVEVNAPSAMIHVYTVQTRSGLFLADGIVTHNCRCWLHFAR